MEHRSIGVWHAPTNIKLNAVFSPRTLDSNIPNNRYINVKRTILSNFLSDISKKGGLGGIESGIDYDINVLPFDTNSKTSKEQISFINYNHNIELGL